MKKFKSGEIQWKIISYMNLGFLLLFIFKLLFFDVHRKYAIYAYVADICVIILYARNFIRFRRDDRLRKVREVERALDREIQFSTTKLPVTMQVRDTQGNLQSITIYHNDSR